MNQELEQYLQFFVDYRQKNQLEWLVIAELIVNNKIHSTTEMSSFIVNYRRELRIGVDIRKKEKVKKTMKFTKRIKKVQKEDKVVLKKA